ncbi:MAG: family 16 glycoside hydrolase [Candidatus Hydrogenedentota bacterium]
MRMQTLFAASLAACMFIGSLAGAQMKDEGDWINLYDQETTYGWHNLGDVIWEVKGGVLTSSAGTGGLLATTSQFSNFELTAKIKVSAGGSAGLVFRAPLTGHPLENGSSVIWMSSRKNEKTDWQDIHVVANGGDVKAMLDGSDSARKVVIGTNERGHIGIMFHHNGDTKVEISEVKLRPLGLKSIFNGKNLDGWNILPDHASKFSVDDGGIRIQDGNGQIETAGVYKDFVLQLDIFSNGTHLNSGVFFRGPVGVFWKGYESQVRNHWSKDDRTNPVDYGTGGNYGNQSTRKVVPSDKEWFKKTVVADGNHFSIWINGYQTSDFTDNRPVDRSFNAKEGYVGAAGTIHLQGHDPTTDLTFKNIYIQEN